MTLLTGWRFHVLPGDSEYETVRMMESAGATRTSLKNADIVIFTGGTDVNPTIYGEKPHRRTQRPDHDRDTMETQIYHAAKAKHKLQVGICRGGQLLNVLNGGSLIQHIDNHTGTTHPMLYWNGKSEKFIIPVTSDHHQMMVPTDKCSVWGKASESMKLEGDGYVKHRISKTHNEDIEIVFYRGTRSLCFQPHPEWGLISCREVFFDCIKRAMIDSATGATT